MENQTNSQQPPSSLADATAKAELVQVPAANLVADSNSVPTADLLAPVLPQLVEEVPGQHAPEVIPAAEPPVRDPLLGVGYTSLPFKIFWAVSVVAEWFFGVSVLIVGLATLSVIPIVQFMTLGYLLEVSGRVARTGKLSEACVGRRKAAQVGSMLLGTFLMTLPVRLVSDMHAAAQLIEPGSQIANNWGIGVIVCTFLCTAHILMSCYCGGRFRYFMWPLLVVPIIVVCFVQHSLRKHRENSLFAWLPTKLKEDIACHRPVADWWFAPAIIWHDIRQGGMYQKSRDTVFEFVVSLRLPYYFWLGLRGFAGSIAWLVIPVALLMISSFAENPGPAAISGILGSLAMAVVALYLPYLQTHFACEGRFGALFEVGQVREYFRRCPLMFWVGLFVTVLMSIPLYLLKIELTPREVTGVLSLFFITFIFPARAITGWAMAMAKQRTEPAFFLFRWLARLGAIPVVAAFVLFVFVSRYVVWNGAYSLFEQHAFLLPVPFVQS